MKKFFRSMMLVAVAAMGFVACQNEFTEPNVNEPNAIFDEVVISFVADEASTRTSVDTSGDEPKFSWDENETFAVLEQTDVLAVGANVTYEKVDGKANISAAFAKNEGKDAYEYVTIYPASGFVSAKSISETTLTLPATQTMTESSYDPKADLMVSKVVTTTAQPTEAQQVQFKRVAAVVEMTLKNFSLEAGDEVEQVIFDAEGKALAGTIVADLNDLKEFTVDDSVSSVSVATTSCNKVYFNVLPTQLEAGDAYTITVITAKKLYIKQGTIPAEKALSFEAGLVNRFGVNMMGVVGCDKWVLVRDASTLKQGDIVTIAAKNYNYVIGKQANNYPLASQTEVVKFGDYLYHPIATAATSVDNRLQSYTLMQRDANRVAFDFYNGVDYEGDTTVGFVHATGSNYAPKIQAFCDVNTLFEVTITDGVATLYASEIEGTYKWWRYYHSTTAGSRRFDCTKSEPIGNNQVCIYKLEGGVGTIPTIDANVTVPDADESIVIAEEGAAEPTAISTEQVTFNYVGEWTISAKAEADWLSVAYDAANNCLTYTAEANTGAKRETTVTITASMEGKESLTWSFTVQQKGAPQEISIADFIKLAKDENSTYKLTGRIVTLATNATSSGYYLADNQDNQVKINYLDTENGENVWGHDNITLKIGDVVTVTTVAVGNKTGGNSSHPSIYKGHYGISATAGLAADYTGGSVEIKVETYSNGIITIPDVVTATMAESDFAEFSAYDGGDTATVNFMSENTTSYAREAEVTFTYGLTSVTVIAQQNINPANKLGYELVTDASTLAVDDEVIIVAVGSEKALGCYTGTSSITGISNFPAVNIVKSGSVIYDVEEASAVIFTVADCNVDGKFALQFTHKTSSYYLYVGSSLKGSTSLGNYTRFSIDIESEGGVATITNSASTASVITFNATSGKFGATKVSSLDAADTSNDIAIYKKQK